MSVAARMFTNVKQEADLDSTAHHPWLATKYDLRLIHAAEDLLKRFMTAKTAL